MSKTVAIYMRVSSTGQDTRSQKAELEAYAARCGQQVKWYEDKSTGTTLDRPGFNAVLEAIRKGEVSALVVWRIDRLGRTAAGLVQLFDDLRAASVNLVSIKDSLDLSTPAGRLMANVLASVASFETEVRRERQSAGIAAAKAEGKTWGGRKEGSRWKVSSEQEQAIHGMRKEGKPIAVIARTLNLSRPTVYSVLA